MQEPLAGRIRIRRVVAAVPVGRRRGRASLRGYPVQAGLMLACVLLAWPLSRWLGYRGYGAYALTRRHGWQTWLSAGLLLAVLAKFGVVWLGLRLGVYTADAATPRTTR
ncbi:hypothetical protein [Rhodanobacter lindaniclasticus]